MKLTDWQRKQYLQVHKQLPMRTVEEGETLLKVSDELSQDGDIEIDDSLMKKAYKILKDYQPSFPQTKESLELLKTLEDL